MMAIKLLIAATIGLALLLNGPLLSSANEGTPADKLALFEELKQNVTKIPYEHWRDVSRIADHFRVLLAFGKDQIGYPTPSKHAKKLIIVLKSFLRTKLMRNKAPLLELYQKHVIEPCKDWVSAAEGVRDFSHADLEATKELIKFVRNVHKADICKYIIENDQVLQGDLGLERSEIEEVTGKIQFDSGLCTPEFILSLENDIHTKQWWSDLEEQNLERYISLCSNVLQDEVNDNWLKLSEEDKSDVESISARTEQVRVRFLSSRYVDEALKEFLDTKSQGQEQTLSRYDLFQKHVVEPCKNWNSALSTMLKFVDYSSYHSILFFNDLHEEERTNSFVKNIENFDVCKLILKEQKTIEKELSVKTGVAGLISKCFGCQ